jgi:FdrA protein
VEDAQSQARHDGRELLVVASVTGTEGDPQGLNKTVSTLAKSGVIVCDSNAAAARLTSMLVLG